MTSMTTATGSVTGGVDTHGQTHHGAVLDQVGRQLGDREFPATPSGYGALLQWMSGYGVLDRVGVEGTGTYGAALTRHLVTANVRVVEVDRPPQSTAGSRQVRSTRRLLSRPGCAVWDGDRDAEAP